MIKGITLKEIVDQTKVEAAKVFEVYNIYQTKLHNRAIDKKDYTGLFNNPIIQTLQSKEVQLRCKNSNSEDRFSLQVQYQLSYNLDSEVSEKSLNWEGGICA